MHPTALSAAGSKHGHQVLAHQSAVEEQAEPRITGMRSEIETQHMLRREGGTILFPALMSSCVDQSEITLRILREFIEAQL